MASTVASAINVNVPQRTIISEEYIEIIHHVEEEEEEVEVQEEEFFELDLEALEDKVREDVVERRRPRRRSSLMFQQRRGETSIGGEAEALLANCLLPVDSICNAIPINDGAGALLKYGHWAPAGLGRHCYVQRNSGTRKLIY